MAGVDRLDLTYDREADASYVQLGAKIGDGEIVTNIMVDDPRLGGYVVLDLDAGGRLRGIEIIGARKLLDPVLLQ